MKRCAITLLCIALVYLPARAEVPACAGDCNGDGETTVDEIVNGVRMVLGDSDLYSCPAFDSKSDGAITVDEVIAGINSLLFGCDTVVRVFSICDDSLQPGKESRPAFHSTAIPLFAPPQISLGFSGTIKLARGPIGPEGTASVWLLEDAIISSSLIEDVACFKMLAAGSSGTINCEPAPRPDSLLEVDWEDPKVLAPTILEEGVSRIGDVLLQVSMLSEILPQGTSPTECENVTEWDLGSGFPVGTSREATVMTSGEATTLTDNGVGTPSLKTMTLEGEPFSCEDWGKENGPGMLVVPLVGYVTPLCHIISADVMRLADSCVAP